jgi:thiol-disulfide isomerase/thioredoxin
MDWKTIVLGILALALVAVIGLAISGTYVLKTKETFENPNPPTTPTFTMFFAEWCGHCKKTKPGFTEFMTSNTGKDVVIDMVDADGADPRLKSLPVKGYPTFLLQKPDGSIVEYKGARETAGYLEFLNKELGLKITA